MFRGIAKKRAMTMRPFPMVIAGIGIEAITIEEMGCLSIF